ncbi:MAG: DNA-processing protein DprA [Candidatus Peregrinibacteria bacterium]
MDRSTALTLSWLNVLTKKRYDALLQAFGDLSHAREKISEDLLFSLGCRTDTILKTINRLEEFDPDMYERELSKRSLQFLTIEDDLYPSRLREIADPPVFLYSRGDLEILNQPGIALVGTREMSDYGKRVAEDFAAAFVQAGLITVSGLALGIDACVARETLRASGKTVASLGHGLGQIYPRENSHLADEIVACGGLLLTEFPLDTMPDKYTFPARNRIIAGLSLGTVVLEAPLGSGALITADLALDYGRDVFAVPGQIYDPNYAGCHRIIAQGTAKLITAPSDVLVELGIVAAEKRTNSFQAASPEEEAIFHVLTPLPQPVEDLVRKSSLSAGTVNGTLTILELQGAAKRVGNGMWVKT